nr:hypothetical protein GCM10020185_57640 [Pseudomonas brassicacearum subsp. brassicacearum]
MRKLEDSGVIKGYCAQLDPTKLGYGISAVVGITTLKPAKSKLIATLTDIPEVVECLHITGNDSYLIRIYARSMAEIEDIIAKNQRVRRDAYQHCSVHSYREKKARPMSLGAAH